MKSLLSYSKELRVKKLVEEYKKFVNLNDIKSANRIIIFTDAIKQSASWSELHSIMCEYTAMSK